MLPKTRKYVTFTLELKRQEDTGKPVETVSGVLDNMGTLFLKGEETEPLTLLMAKRV